jgi:hypothetical protein
MIVSAVRGTQTQLLALLKADVTGKNNYIYWSIAILGIGAVGYIKELKPFATALLVLVVVVLFLDSKGVFTQFVSAINSTQSASSTTPANAATATQPNTGLGLGNLFTSLANPPM